MSTDYWIKAYHEILDDPKMGALPDRIWRRVMEIFLCAGRVNQGGQLPPTEKLAWMLRMEAADLAPDMAAIEKTGIIQQNEGGWFVVQFAERQAPVPGAERTRRSRERTRKEQYYGPPPTRNVTPPGNGAVTDETRNVTQNRTEQNTTTSTGAGAPEPAPNVYGVYEQEIGVLTPLIADQLAAAEDAYPPGWVESALREAALNNARAWKYAEAILKRWQAEGFKSDTRRNGNHKARAAPRAQSPPKDTDLEYLRLNLRKLDQEDFEAAFGRLKTRGVEVPHEYLAAYRQRFGRKNGGGGAGTDK